MMRKKETPDEQRIRRRIHARRLFKAMVHLVIENLFWLEEMQDEDLLGEDVQKNIALLMKKKKDKKCLLTYYDKITLNKPTMERTEEEKDHLFNILGNLKCFRKYPTDVKKELAASCYFVYYPPGRVVVKQKGQGHSLYFIMSGEVAVSITLVDPVLNEEKTVVVGTMVTGQMFGEVSLLHDIPRTATITTLTPCEMIVLHKVEFNRVLKVSLQAVWDQILYAMSRFRYFDGWDEVSNRECCIYSRIKTYRKHQVIFGEGHHDDNFVHFILKGQCQVIELMPVVEIKIGHHKSYKLFDRETYKAEVFEKRKLLERLYGSKIGKFKAAMQEHFTEKNVPAKIHITPSRGTKRFSMASRKSVSSSRRGSDYEIVEQPSVGEDRLIDMDDLKKKLGIFKEVEETVEDPDFVKIIFMQVCLFRELACFGLGENMENRRIVADTDVVECLLVPKFWIWTKNKGNLWTNVMQTLDHKIPNTHDVFEIFAENRRWGAWKRNLVNTIRSKPPCNVYNNVPYSVRLKEDVCYGVKYR